MCFIHTSSLSAVIWISITEKIKSTTAPQVYVFRAFALQFSNLLQTVIYFNGSFELNFQYPDPGIKYHNPAL